MAAVNQGGKRKGRLLRLSGELGFDIQEFLELRENTGDNAQRT